MFIPDYYCDQCESCTFFSDSGGELFGTCPSCSAVPRSSAALAVDNDLDKVAICDSYKNAPQNAVEQTGHTAQKELIYMENLTTYSPAILNNNGVAEASMCKTNIGEFVKLSDIKELLQTTPCCPKCGFYRLMNHICPSDFVAVK